MHPPIFGAVFFLAEALEQKWCANAAVTEWSTQPFYSSRPVASGFWYVCEYDVASKPLAKHFTTSAIVIGLWLLFMCLQLKKKIESALYSDKSNAGCYNRNTGIIIIIFKW